MSSTGPLDKLGAVRSTPWATYALLAALIACYFWELSFCPGSRSGPGNPGRDTLVAMGGVSRRLVLADGQWFRMLTAAFIHSSAAHLILNCLALFFGRALEKAVGSAWFLAIYLMAALGGSALSIVANSVSLLSVGASGAILGIFGAQVVIAYAHFPKGDERTRLAQTAWRVLIPTLAAFTGRGGGTRIDFAAHVGGALTGALAGYLLTLAWPPGRARPPAQSLAWLITGACCAVLVYAVAYPIRHSQC